MKQHPAARATSHRFQQQKSSKSNRKPQGEVLEHKFIKNLQTLLSSQYPNKVPVDAVPELFLKVTGTHFPLLPESIPPGPDGLARLLGGKFSKIFIFTQNKEGRVFMSLRFRPEVDSNEVVRYYTLTPRYSVETEIEFAKLMIKTQPAAEPTTSASPAVLMIPPAAITPELNESYALVAKGVHEVLKLDPQLGEADSMETLRKNILEGYFALFNLPLAVNANRVPLDPVLILQQFQGVLFSKITLEPVTGSVCVKSLALAPNASFLPAIVDVNKSQKTVCPPEMTPGLNKLKTQLLASVAIIDAALDGTAGPFFFPDVELWKDALEELVAKETENGDVLRTMFTRLPNWGTRPN